MGQTERCVRAILPSLFQPALQETQELIQVQSHVCRPPEVVFYFSGKPQTLVEDRERILAIGRGTGIGNKEFTEKYKFCNRLQPQIKTQCGLKITFNSQNKI